MRERINRLAKGMIETTVSQIKIVPEQFFEGIPTGEISHREIRIVDKDNSRLKGLIYSSNSCVRLLQPTFNGSDNRITIEIDGRYLTKEDNIDGTFSFIMDGEERMIPYSFWMEPKNTIEVLESLKTKHDFARLVAKDFKQALVLFSYKDFDTAPFMQDQKVRVLYEGLKGYGSNSHRLEEFLVALQVKEPIKLKVSQEMIGRSQRILVTKNTWGYIDFQVVVEGDFIEIEQCHYDMEDFDSNQCKVLYRICTEKLHCGKNIGSITIVNVRERFQIPIESWGIVTFQKERWKQKELWLQQERQHLQDIINGKNEGLERFPLEEQNLGGYKKLFKKGVHSPFLYVKAFEIYQNSPELFYNMGDFEIQVLNFAQKYDLIEEKLASDLASMANVPLQILYKLYEKFALVEILSAICRILIKKDCKHSRYFIWYERAFMQKLPITKLYEYYLNALPKDYNKLLPTEILLYFSYEHIIEHSVKEILYPNIMAYMPTDLLLFRQYRREIERFTVDELLKGNMNPHLAFLYQKVLYPEMIDEKIANVLPKLLQSYFIQVNNPNITHAVVCYQELIQEDIIQLKDGIGYVPLCLEGATLLFQDGNGNRYVEIPHVKDIAIRGMNRKEMELGCSKYCPSHPTLRLQECEAIVKSGILCQEDVAVIQSVLKELKLHPHYQKKLQRLVLYYYQETVVEKSNLVTTFLNSLNLKELSRKERAVVCEILIDADYMLEAFKLMREYGWEEVQGTHLLKLCHYMILKITLNQGDFLTTLAFQAFLKQQYSKELMMYLCKYFNGSSNEMFAVLEIGLRYQVGVHDLLERLLAQMIFTDETEHINQVFEWYLACGKTQENIVKAFFTVKSVKYFFEQQETSSQVFYWLEGALERVGDMGKAPTLYLMTLTKYYSDLKELDKNQIKLCIKMVEHLLLEKRVFPHFINLIKVVPALAYLEERVIVSHYVTGKEKPQIIVRILPQEERFQPSHMSCVYPGVYVLQNMLFDGEILEYQIYEGQGDNRICTQKGQKSRHNNTKTQHGTQYDLLNQMECELEDMNLEVLKATMKQYITEQITMELLFPFHLE